MSLILHKGGRKATAEEVQAIACPPAEGRWHPVSHQNVLETVRGTLSSAGYQIARESYGLSADNARFFGVLDLTAPLAGGVTLSVGIRNSVDKTFPIGFAAGSRVFVCDNLAFSAELMVKRKHTINGMKAFDGAVAAAVGGLASFREAEAGRIIYLAGKPVDDRDAHHYILSAYRRGLINSQQIGPVCGEWERPTHEEFSPRNAWSLFNAFTEVLRERALLQPAAFTASTIRLGALLGAGDDGRIIPGEPEIN